jgi:hypothetical protein
MAHIVNAKMREMEDLGMLRIGVTSAILQNSIPQLLRPGVVGFTAGYRGAAANQVYGTWAPRWAVKIASLFYFTTQVRSLLVVYFASRPDPQTELLARLALRDDLYAWLITFGPHVPGWPATRYECWDRARIKSEFAQGGNQGLASQFIDIWDPFNKDAPMTEIPVSP